MFQTATIKFLKDLKKDNNKPWFDANRKRYEEAKNDFAQFIQSVLEKHGKKDAAIKDLKAKDCMFRINRDIRFSKDKSPYKTNFGASMNRGGKKSIYAGYYFHLEPSESFVGGGLWMPQDVEQVEQSLEEPKSGSDECPNDGKPPASAQGARAHNETPGAAPPATPNMKQEWNRRIRSSKS